MLSEVSPVSSGDVGLDVALRTASGAYRLVRVLGSCAWARITRREGLAYFVTTIFFGRDAPGVWQMVVAFVLLRTGRVTPLGSPTREPYGKCRPPVTNRRPEGDGYIGRDGSVPVPSGPRREPRLRWEVAVRDERASPPSGQRPRRRCEVASSPGAASGTRQGLVGLVVSGPTRVEEGIRRPPP